MERKKIIRKGIISFLMGFVLFFMTWEMLGAHKAARSPGGAVAAAFVPSLAPLYISIPFAIMGHLVGVLIAYLFVGHL